MTMFGFHHFTIFSVVVVELARNGNQVNADQSFVSLEAKEYRHSRAGGNPGFISTLHSQLVLSEEGYPQKIGQGT